jgi:3-phosphoshikimate 1-carboxyvinyltransferase
MRERPIQDLVEGLQQVGVHIEYLMNPGYPPVKIFPGTLQGGTIRIKGNLSSQYLSSLLMASPLATHTTCIEIEGEQVSKPYVDLTLAVMEAFGVKVEREAYARFTIAPNQQYLSPGDAFVEGDASGASYFLSAAAIRGGTVRVHGVGRNSVQGDVRYADVLERMGARVNWGDYWIEVSRGELRGIDIDMNDQPDAAMTLAVVALFAKGPTAIRNIYNLRVKETDRLTAMATELRKVGATVEEGEDYIAITPPERLQSAAIDTYDDHRIAMSFSLAALGDVEITINDQECVSKTFPDYFERFSTICTL